MSNTAATTAPRTFMDRYTNEDLLARFRQTPNLLIGGLIWFVNVVDTTVIIARGRTRHTVPLYKLHQRWGLSEGRLHYYQRKRTPDGGGHYVLAEVYPLSA